MKHVSIATLLIFSTLLFAIPSGAQGQNILPEAPPLEQRAMSIVDGFFVDYLNQIQNLSQGGGGFGIPGTIGSDPGEAGDPFDGFTIDELLNNPTELLEGLSGAANQNLFPLTIDASPKYPNPGDTVTLTISDYGKSVDGDPIEWYVNGELYRQGVGLKSIDYTMGAVGDVRIFIAKVDRGATEDVTNPTIVSVNQIDMLWEVVGAYTPPFYKGKALPSYDAYMKVTSKPIMYRSNGTVVPEDGLVYEWMKNSSGLTLIEQSGYGKQAAYILANFARTSHSVTADISDPNSGVTGFGFTSFQTRDPELLFYEIHPTKGVIFERALPAEITRTPGESMKVLAAPYWIDWTDSAPLEFTWSLNGQTLEDSSERSRGEISIFTEEGQTGVSRLSVEVEHPSKILQFAEESLRISVENDRRGL